MAQRGFEESLVVVAPAGTIALDAVQALQRHPFLRFDRSQRTGVQIDRSLRRLGVRVEEFLELNAIETVVALIRHDIGASLLPLVRRESIGKLIRRFGNLRWGPTRPRGVRLA